MITANNRTPPVTALEHLDVTARQVQDVAYALASRIDSTTLTELMLVSRKLERLSERVQAANLGAVVVNPEGDL